MARLARTREQGRLAPPDREALENRPTRSRSRLLSTTFVAVSLPHGSAHSCCARTIGNRGPPKPNVVASALHFAAPIEFRGKNARTARAIQEGRKPAAPGKFSNSVDILQRRHFELDTYDCSCRTDRVSPH